LPKLCQQKRLGLNVAIHMLLMCKDEVILNLELLTEGHPVITMLVTHTVIQLQPKDVGPEPRACTGLEEQEPFDPSDYECIGAAMAPTRSTRGLGWAPAGGLAAGAAGMGSARLRMWARGRAQLSPARPGRRPDCRRLRAASAGVGSTADVGRGRAQLSPARPGRRSDCRRP